MYKYTLIFMRFNTKLYLYLFGLTDKYPGFSMDENGLFTLKYDKPATSSRLLAFPLLGFLIRMILLIPFSLYISVVQMGAFIAVFCSWFVVLFTGRYPESFYEIVRDYLRLWNASFLYSFYLSDTYPSFRISMNHKTVKIILLILGLLLVFGNFFSSLTSTKSTPNNYHYTNPPPN